MGSIVPILELIRVSYNFEGRRIFDSISFEVRESEIVGISGGIGCGKSTLLKVCATLLKPSSGVVKRYGEDISALPRKRLLELRRDMGMVFQNSALISNMTLYENIALPILYHTDLTEREVKDRIYDICELVRFKKNLHLRPALFPPGERKRAALMRALVLNPSLLIWDDLIPEKDIDSIDIFFDIMKMGNGKMRTCIVSSPSLMFLRQVSNKIIELSL